MRHHSSALAAASLLLVAGPASASTYIALGDSITFGETDLNYAQYAGILSNIASTAPGASVYLLGYYNPFPADPTSPGAPLFNTYGTELNGIIQSLAGQFGATYVDVAPAFVGREAELTYLDDQPHGFVRTGAFGGTEPIGNVHPNAAGYAVITQRLDAAATGAVPEPSSWVMMLVGFAVVGSATRSRRQASVA